MSGGKKLKKVQRHALKELAELQDVAGIPVGPGPTGVCITALDGDGCSITVASSFSRMEDGFCCTVNRGRLAGVIVEELFFSEATGWRVMTSGARKDDWVECLVTPSS